jgi:hypothetical protein
VRPVANGDAAALHLVANLAQVIERAQAQRVGGHAGR